MLYSRLAADEFDTDVIEVLRESVPAARRALEGIARDDVEQIYLFFDYDPHQNNVAEDDSDSLLETMISVFDNEHENGKLYISYPMVEALHDYRSGQCQSHTGCFLDWEDIPAYKRLSSEGNRNASLRMYFLEWKDVLSSFALRCKCLLTLDAVSFEEYRESVSVRTLFGAERRLLRGEGRLFVLSAFPEFLLDYHDVRFFNSMVRIRKLKFDECPLA
ncbi:hypothetical protein [Collinsella intestinalis]|uniref:hypothetical protein n=1 Tax=Collinsella intestinalis TaxID=147207 RepID=UPI00195BC2EB|nr:hypothetical protein [Collinsella intestinalis]